MEIETGEHLYNFIADLTGFNCLEDDMRGIVAAIQEDNPHLKPKYPITINGEFGEKYQLPPMEFGKPIGVKLNPKSE